MEEQVLYELPQVVTRVLFPKACLLVVLGILFYVGMLLNLSFLDLRADEETLVNIGSLIIVGVIILSGVFMSYKQAQKKYVFLKDRIILGEKEINYHAITNTMKKQNFWDKLFKTYSIKLGEGFQIKNVSLERDVENYIGQLVEYAKKKEG